MKKKLVLIGIAILIAAVVLIGCSPSPKYVGPLYVKGDLSVLVLSTGLDNPKIFVDEIPYPFQFTARDIEYVFDPQINEPYVEIWLKKGITGGKDIVEKVVVHFKNGDQLREYVK